MLYVQVERARGMGRIVTIPFATGDNRRPDRNLRPSGKAQIAANPKVCRRSDGRLCGSWFCRYQGGPPKEHRDFLAASRQCREDFEGTGRCYERHSRRRNGKFDTFDSKNLDKNRVVEVWAVLP